MARNLKKSTKGALAVVAAASINGAFFLPSAMASEVSDLDSSAGLRINRADCSRTQELQQANQAPQQVLQLLRGDEDNSARTPESAEAANSKDDEESLARSQRLNTATNDLEPDDLAAACCTRIADEDFADEAESRIRDADMAEESSESGRQNDLRQTRDNSQEVLKLFGSENDQERENTRISDSEKTQELSTETSQGRLSTGKRINTAGDDAVGLEIGDRKTVTCATENLTQDDSNKVADADSNELPTKEAVPAPEAAPVNGVQAEDAVTLASNSDQSGVVSAAPASTKEQAAVTANDNGATDVDSGTLARTGSNAQFAGFVAVIAAAVGALMMFFSRKKRHQN